VKAQLLLLFFAFGAGFMSVILLLQTHKGRALWESKGGENQR
jgi:preprotein translocase subunit SecG